MVMLFIGLLADNEAKDPIYQLVYMVVEIQVLNQLPTGRGKLVGVP